MNEIPTIKGRVRSLNLSPRGVCESFLMNDGKRIVQINLAKDAGDDAAKRIKPGHRVSVKAETHSDVRPSEHPVFDWIDDGKALHKGVVKQINYARHGEPNGAILATGEFVHLRPEGAKAIKLKLGQKLSVEGESRTSPHGHVVIEAAIVNGLDLHNDKKAAKAKKHSA